MSRASRPARSRSGAGASAGRSKRRRVRAVSARLEDVQKVLTEQEDAFVWLLSRCLIGDEPYLLKSPTAMLEKLLTAAYPAK
jgi:hypothetical protein